MDLVKISKLTAEIKKGSETHFKILFDETHRIIFGVCLKMNLKREDAEDIVQETYIQFWIQRNSIDEHRGVIGLLKIIARRLVFKKVSSKQREVELSMNVPDRKEVDNNDLKGILSPNLLKRDIEKLPKCQKQIINLFYFEGLTTVEISNYLGISGRTVENNMYRAKKKLRVILNNGIASKRGLYNYSED